MDRWTCLSVFGFLLGNCQRRSFFFSSPSAPLKFPNILSNCQVTHHLLSLKDLCVDGTSYESPHKPHTRYPLFFFFSLPGFLFSVSDLGLGQYQVSVYESPNFRSRPRPCLHSRL